jgi:hypothetical protein
MTPRMRRAVVSFFVVVALSTAGPFAHSRPSVATNECLEIAHIGNQDRPVDSLRMCIGEKGKSRADGILGTDWTFGFDTATYRELEAFVVKQRSQSPVGPGGIPFGTFSVTWGAKAQRNKYIVPVGSICRYFFDLIRVVPKEDYAAFVRVVGDLMDLVKCSSRSLQSK